MKKYITLFSFIALLFIGTQQTQAQDADRRAAVEQPEAIAKKKTHELHQMAEMTGDQQRAVFKVLVELHENLNALDANDNIAAVQQSKAALLENTKARMKSILTEEQFKVYLRTLEESNKK